MLVHEKTASYRDTAQYQAPRLLPNADLHLCLHCKELSSDGKLHHGATEAWPHCPCSGSMPPMRQLLPLAA